MTKLLILDRDGVINVDNKYVHEIDKFIFIKDIFKICKFYQSNDYNIVIATNQSGMGRGYFSEDDFIKLTTWMLSRFKDEGIEIGEVYFCSHHPNDNCNCRKPRIGMFNEICEDYDIDLKKSIMIGDSKTDYEFSKNCGINNFYYINDIIDDIDNLPIF